MKIIITVFLALLLGGCTAKYDLCLPVPGHPEVCHRQVIKTPRRIKSVDASYSADGGLQVKLEGVSGSPLEDAVADKIREGEIIP